jgi:hypothetical protein
MTESRTYAYSTSIVALRSSVSKGWRGFCAKWRLNRRCEARAGELETVLREIDPRLARDIGFNLMASRRGDDGTIHSHALIQAASIAFAEEPARGDAQD